MHRQATDDDPTSQAFPVEQDHPSSFHPTPLDDARPFRSKPSCTRAYETRLAYWAGPILDRLSSWPPVETTRRCWPRRSVPSKACIAKRRRSALAHNGYERYGPAMQGDRYLVTGCEKHRSTPAPAAGRRRRLAIHLVSYLRQPHSENSTLPRRLLRGAIMSSRIHLSFGSGLFDRRSTFASGSSSGLRTSMQSECPEGSGCCRRLE